MADNIDITPGAGKTVSTDDAGASGHVQRVKLTYAADGDATHIPADANGLKVNAGGTAVPVTDNGGSLTVDGTVAISGSVATTGGGGTEFAEDAAHTNGDAGKLLLAVRRDTGAAFTSTDGDYSAIATDSNGRVKVTHDQALPAGGNALGSVSVSNLPATQPVSGTVTVQDGGGAISVDDNGSTLSIDDGGGSITVDGTFYQATQPISGTVTVQDGGNVISVDDGAGSLTVDGPVTDTQLRATPVPVSGTVTANAGTGPFPVSDNGGSLTVDGTFWQATQPVSGPVTDAQLRAAAVPVSGSFYQATQPVSIPQTQTFNGMSQVLVFDAGVRNVLNEILLVLKDIRGLQMGAEGGRFNVD